MPLRKKAMILIAFYLRLPVLGFSIGRNYYTMQLRQPSTDPGTGSALVVIWLEVELAYALAASTLSALKAFTESFNSGFGLGFTRGKSVSGYGMSDVSGSSSGKSKNTAGQESSVDASRKDSVAREATKDNTDIIISPVSPTQATTNEQHQPLKLRPETTKNVTHVSADPMYSDHGVWREGSIGDSHNSSEGDDMVIIRETAYDVQHDRAPMLPMPAARVFS